MEANENPCAVEPVLKANGFTASKLELTDVADVTAAAALVAAANWNNPAAPSGAWGWGFKDPVVSVFGAANWNVPVTPDAAVPSAFEPKLNGAAGVVEGPAAFAMKVNGKVAVDLVGAEVFTAWKLNGGGTKLVVLIACDEVVVAEVVAAPNWNVVKLDSGGATRFVNGLLLVTDDAESPTEVLADDGVAAPKVKGDGAPEGAEKENPEVPAVQTKHIDNTSMTIGIQ